MLIHGLCLYQHDSVNVYIAIEDDSLIECIECLLLIAFSEVTVCDISISFVACQLNMKLYIELELSKKKFYHQKTYGIMA